MPEALSLFFQVTFWLALGFTAFALFMAQRQRRADGRDEGR